jgi:hypothetical protein
MSDCLNKRRKSKIKLLHSLNGLGDFFLDFFDSLDIFNESCNEILAFELVNDEYDDEANNLILFSKDNILEDEFIPFKELK